MNFSEKDLSKLNGQELLTGLEYLVRTERRITYQVLRFIHEIDARKIYLEEGYESVYIFLCEKYKYSERSALRRINAAKLLKIGPQICEKIQDGRINLSQLDRVQQCLKQEAKSGRFVSTTKTAEIINLVESKNMFETEKVLSKELNFKPQSFEKARPQSDNSVRLEIIFTEAQFATLKKAQSYSSHVIHDNSYAELIVHLAKKIIASVEGKTKTFVKPTQGAGASPNLAASERRTAQRKTASGKTRQYVQRNLKRRLLQDSKNCCSYVHSETGRKCGSQFQLQIDHIVPLAKGGANCESNLRLLCGVHNRQEAIRWGLHLPTLFPTSF